jgi:hypothetical protein
MIADPEGPSFITRTVGRRRYADDASVSHDPVRTWIVRRFRLWMFHAMNSENW